MNNCGWRVNILHHVWSCLAFVLQAKDELGVSLAELAKFGKAEFDMEPLADSFMSIVNQPGKVRLGFKLWIEFMVRLCCLPKERFLRLVFRAFDSSGVGKFGLTGMCKHACLRFHCPCLYALSRELASTDFGRMVKALHPKFTRGPFENMMGVCLRNCKMTKETKRKFCTMDEVRCFRCGCKWKDNWQLRTTLPAKVPAERTSPAFHTLAPPVIFSTCDCRHSLHELRSLFSFLCCCSS